MIDITDEKWRSFMTVAAIGLVIDIYSPLISMWWWTASGVFGVILLAIAVIFMHGFDGIDAEGIFMGFWVILAGGVGLLLSIGVIIAFFRSGAISAARG